MIDVKIDHGITGIFVTFVVDDKRMKLNDGYPLDEEEAGKLAEELQNIVDSIRNFAE